ncbi:MAG: ABC transporter ATP-binding protein [Spirochaetota bacterium]
MDNSLISHGHGTTLVIEGIRKTYADTIALDHVSLQIEPGEFFTLLGPSGCGKTTLLRSVAGFVKPDRGKVFFDDQRIDTLPPQKRNIGMVFQDYAVFPHMSVAANVGYGLKSRRVPTAEAQERTTQALQLVGMESLAHRLPAQLSGGQQQRVAVARAVVVRPSVLLMDEPLSNLDAKLRIQMRRDIREMQTSLKITTVYVTHDQAEALAVSDRIAVMSQGKVEQLATPEELYRKPRTPFVARFLGNENIVSGTVVSIDSQVATVRRKGVDYKIPNTEVHLSNGDEVSFLLRSETLEFTSLSAEATHDRGVIRGLVERCEYGGSLLRVFVRIADDLLLEVLSLYETVGRLPNVGEAVTLQYNIADITVFSPEETDTAAEGQV